MPTDETEETRMTVPSHLAALGRALIAGGVYVAIYVLMQLFRVYRDVGGDSFISELSRQFADSTVMTLGDLPLSVTERGATIMAYFVFVPLALLGIHVAATLIRAGTHILSPAFPYQMARLKWKISRLNNKLPD